jgi:periplasmic protein TonB
MIPASRLAAAIALLVAFAVHAGALVVRSGPGDVQIEGGAPAAETALGNAFSDMVAGTNRPVKAVVNKAETPPDTAQKPDIAKVTPKQEPQQDNSQQTPSVTKPAQPTTSQKATTPPPTLSSQTPEVQQNTASVQLPAAQAVPTEAPSPTAQRTLSVDQSETAEQKTDTTQTTTTLTYNEPVAVPATRPVERPVSKPVKPTEPITPEAKQPPKPQSKARPQGNSDQNAKRGAATGTQPKAKTKSGTNSTRTAKPGNAEKSNYLGLVKRKIERKKRRNVNIKGTVRVSFNISASGTLTRLSVSRSSGSAKLDQSAMQQVRRAAPFPAPPGGAPIGVSLDLRSK